MPDEPQLKYRISGEADVGPIQETERSTEGLKGTLGEAATEMRHLTGSSREGQEIMRGFGGAGRAGAAGVGEMIRGLRSLALVATHLIGEGPLGVLLIAIGLIGGALLAMRGHAKEAGDGLEAAGKKADDFAKHLETLKKSAEESLKPVTDRIKEIDEHFAALEKRMHEANAAYDRQAHATRELTDAQNDLAKANAIQAAGGDERKIAAINREYDAKKKVAEATEAVNTVGGKELQLKTELEAANNKAAQTAEAAAQANKAVSDQQEKSAAATQAAAKATEYYEQVLEKQKGTEDARRAAIARADLTLGAGHLAPNAIAALPESLTAKEAAVQVAQADEARRSALAGAREQRSTLEGLQAGARAANTAADKAQSAADTAQLAVENEQLVTQKETLAANIRLELAMKELANAIKENEKKDDERTQKALDKLATENKREADAAARSDAREAKGEAATAAKAHKADEHAATVEARDAQKEHTNVLREMARESKKSLEALKEVHSANRATAEVAIGAAKETRETHRQLLNSLSFNQSP